MSGMPSRCPDCPGVKTCVGGDGPLNADILFVGEAPGQDENRKGLPFIGKTGREVNEHYLPLAGLRRERVRFDNAISCLPSTNQGRLDRKNQKDLELLQVCAQHHLYPEIDEMKPRLIVPMGVFACLALDPDIDLDLHHGRPFPTRFGMAFPMYHPAGGVHEPKKMLHIRTDWVGLRKHLVGKLYQPVDEFAGSEDYSIVESEDDLDAYLWDRNNYSLGCDTEVKRGGDPFCITVSVEPGTGRLIRAWDRHILKRLQWWLDHWEWWIYWHNWAGFDHMVVADMGLTFPQQLIRDTMMQAFHLGNIPQGLKTLAFRELGMAMKDFDDLVKPFSIPRVLQYYRDANAEEWPKPEEKLVLKDDGNYKTYKAHSMNTKLKIFFTYLDKNPDKDPFAAWENWESDWDMIQERLGPWPGKCISHAWEDDRDSVIWYACRDADALVRLEPRLMQMRQRVRQTTQEHWRDVA